MLSKQMMYLMPVFTVIIAMRLPAALPLYWMITTLFAIGQQWYASRQVQSSKVPATAGMQIQNIEDKKEETEYKPKEKIEEINKKIKHGVEVTVRRKK